MGLISKIYGSNQILFAAGSRKGKTRAEIALMVEQAKHKKTPKSKAYIAFLKEKIANAKK
tara:strand:+ start:368 stop:547 length:180 start_codon:yes stop_codon:yes gene_type:complete